MWEHLIPESFEIARIPKHLAHLHGEISQEPRQQGRLVQDAFLHGRNRCKAQRLLSLPQTTLN